MQHRPFLLYCGINFYVRLKQLSFRHLTSLEESDWKKSFYHLKATLNKSLDQLWRIIVVFLLKQWLFDSFPQDYVYPDAKDRQFLHYFYKGARKRRFDVERYNELKEELAEVGMTFLFLEWITTITSSWAKTPFCFWSVRWRRIWGVWEIQPSFSCH